MDRNPPYAYQTGAHRLPVQGIRGTSVVDSMLRDARLHSPRQPQPAPANPVPVRNPSGTLLSHFRTEPDYSSDAVRRAQELREIRERARVAEASVGINPLHGRHDRVYDHRTLDWMSEDRERRAERERIEADRRRAERARQEMEDHRRESDRRRQERERMDMERRQERERLEEERRRAERRERQEADERRRADREGVLAERRRIREAQYEHSDRERDRRHGHEARRAASPSSLRPASHDYPQSSEDEQRLLEMALEQSKMTQQPAPSPQPTEPEPQQPHEFDLEPGNYIRSEAPMAEGAQGCLYRGWSNDKQRQFVIKSMRFNTPGDKESAEIWAFSFMYNISHSNVIRYLKVQSTGKQTLEIFMPIYVEGDLEALIRNVPVGTKLPVDTIISYTLQIASALRYLHSLTSVKSGGMVHRDLKPANVLLTKGKTKCVLIDFDSWGCTGKANREGTHEYLAPETIKTGEACPPSDVWSLGAILYCMLTLPSFPMLHNPVTKESLLLNHESWSNYDLLTSRMSEAAPKTYPAELVTLCCQMLNHNPTRRPTASQVCELLRNYQRHDL
eukprot:TRINITY_DN14800_c0_g1_i1.p1 TRINITY_DN14800_c0_g1~~TRINITY_DN14800_c0_g1_i1.p1  ORF type:complete len:564 (+),score=77.43 TRINITY_DN14800_c0_g1_i1:45-1736(+)